MTKQNYTTEAELEITVDGDWVTFKGTKEQLINEGVCENVTFPEGNKRQNSYFEHSASMANSKNWMIKKIKGGRFVLHKGINNGNTTIRRDRPESYQSIDKWLKHNQSSNKVMLGMIYASFSGDQEKEFYGSVTIKAPKNQIDELRKALLKVDELIDEMTAIRTNPKITQAKQDLHFQSLLKTVVGAE